MGQTLNYGISFSVSLHVQFEICYYFVNSEY
jgi:hypothetical protein